VKILGVELARPRAENGPREHALVLLDDAGSVEQSARVGSLPEVAATVSRLVDDEPFLLGVDIPVVVSAKASRARAVEGLVRRRFGLRLPAGGRAALAGEPSGVAGEALLAGLAAAGSPCLPYPDRDRRRNGLAETHPELTLKALLWDATGGAPAREQADREELFRALSAPGYRAARMPARSGWAEQAAELELLLRALGELEGFDLAPVRDALDRGAGLQHTEWAAALLDAVLIAGTARRYVESPERSLFLGDRESGYLVLPADPFIRRIALADARPRREALFPHASLRERIGQAARLRSMDLLAVPGRPQRIEATFSSRPAYEFDNLDEMLWWKHCRHVDGPRIPTEGLAELLVRLGRDGGGGDGGGNDGNDGDLLRLVRSRHRTLSFRFDPPGAWRARVPTRDGRTYPFRVHRAVYETVPGQD
jgi:predicted RNase H-like nuclease